MPVVINAADHPANGWKQDRVINAEKLLEEACPRQYRRSKRIVQSSFMRSQIVEAHVSASKNAFVWAAYHAYSEHHHLVIRPEDVWFAILTQISFYVNAHAEELRAFFVDHQGQKELEVFSDVPDFGLMVRQMTYMLAKNVTDPKLRDWVMPAFTTTTDDDKVVGAIIFMGAMQAYFTYKMTVTCGIPSVTLLGEVDDWKEILRRVDQIDLLGEEPKQFAAILRPILQHMILSFEDPTSSKVTDFWNTIVHRHVLGSGTDYLSGWLTAFCFWNEEGKPKPPSARNLLFGQVQFPTVNVDRIPAGFATVPVSIDDNGHEYEATMIAGSVGIAASGSPEPLTQSNEGSTYHTSTNIRDTVQAVSGWWMCENEAKEAAAARDAEKRRLQDDLQQIEEKWHRDILDAVLDDAYWTTTGKKCRTAILDDAYRTATSEKFARLNDLRKF